MQGNNQDVIHIATSRSDGVLKVSGFQTLKLWCFIHNHVMQSHLHCAEQVVIKIWAEDALMGNQEYSLSRFWYSVTHSY
jgi:hypothetical protein